MNRKGQVVNFGNAAGLVISLVVMVLVAAAGIIGVIAFKNSNSSSAAANTSLDYGVTGIGNFTAQMPTVGTMLGIGLVLLVIVGVFAYGIMRRGGGGL